MSLFICRSCSQRIHGLVELGAGDCSSCLAVYYGHATPESLMPPPVEDAAKTFACDDCLPDKPAVDDVSVRLLKSVWPEGAVGLD